MKLFKYVIPVLGLAVATAFTACSDDVDHGNYADGQQSPGAFFATSLPTSYEINLTESTFDVTVNRTSAEAPATYPISLSATYTTADADGNPVANDGTSAFVCPAQVQFEGDAVETSVVISVNPEKILQGQTYDVALTLQNATEYGDAVYNFQFVQRAPIEMIPAGPEGKGTYLYNGFFSGADPDLKCYYSYDETNPNERTYYLENWGGGVTLQIVMPDVNDVDANGCIPVYVPMLDINYMNGANATGAGCYYSFMKYLGVQGYETVYGGSYFNPETGLFTLDMAYFLWPQTGDNEGRWYGQFTEQLQLAGYPDYSVEVNYDGYFTNDNGEVSAIATVSGGPDVAKILATMVAGTDVTGVADELAAGNIEDAVEVEGNAAQRVVFNLSEAGEYTIVVVALDAAGQRQADNYTSFEILLGESKYGEEYETEMLDGWFTILAFDNPDDAVIPVTMAQTKENPDVWALLHPYEILGFNDCPAQSKRDILVDCSLPGYAFVEPQLSGFYCEQVGLTTECFIYDRNGYVLSVNEGVTQQQVVDFIIANDQPLTTVTDGLVEIPQSYFSDDPSQGSYAWTDAEGNRVLYPTMIVLPTASAQAKAKAKAKLIGNPKFNGISRSARASFRQINGKAVRPLILHSVK